MTTITIEITDEQADGLAQEAERMHLSLKDLATLRLLNSPESSDGTESEFETAMSYVFEKNSELYRRLAS